VPESPQSDTNTGPNQNPPLAAEASTTEGGGHVEDYDALYHLQRIELPQVERKLAHCSRHISKTAILVMDGFAAT